jgi:hypothetical protein
MCNISIESRENEKVVQGKRARGVERKATGNRMNSET